MKWMQWISKWFGGSTKALGSVGIGLRTALGGGAPGGWASDHREETAHNTGFNYIAIHAIAAQVAGASVIVFADGDQQSQRRSRRKSLATRVGSFARWKSTYGADDRETDPLPATHPLVHLLKRPNPHESGASFRYRQAQQMRLTGTCLVWNVPSLSGPTCERYVIPTAMASPVAPTMELPRGGWRISPIASRYTPIVDDGYVDCPSWYRILGQIVDARQVQVIRLPHAWYLDDGQSPLSAGAKWVDAGEAVDAARFHQLKNGIDPSVVWNLPPDVSPDQDEIDRVQAKISAKYGGPENVGRVMVAQSGTSITPLSTCPKDMCYTEGFHDFKAAILALHQTPPVAVGLQEPGAYAAYNASMKAWRHAAVQPLCDMLAESDTEHLAPQFGSGLTVEIESDTVDDTDLIELQLQNDLAAKVRTKNEWRAVRGMPPLPGAQGDELVGTDSSHTTHPSSEQPTFSGEGQPDSSENDEPRTKASRKPGLSSEVVNETTSGTLHDPLNERDRNRAKSPLDPVSEHNENDVIRAGLIADILYGLFGSSAWSVVDKLPKPISKAFDPDLHPRDERGRFERNGSSGALAAAREEISRILRGGYGDRSDPKIVEALKLLTRSELEALHREHGVTAPPKLKDYLVESVLVRLSHFCHPSDESSALRILPRYAPTDRIDVYVQDEEELNRIVNRKMSLEQWGAIVGAQPGARVYVYPDSDCSVTISVEHPDYWARRVVHSNWISNEEIEISPEKQGQGLGTQILLQQVHAAAELKFKYLEASAIGDGEELPSEYFHRPSGYYTWARLGYEGRIAPLLKERGDARNNISDEAYATIADFRSKFPGVKMVSEMMLTPERREWWKKYGGHFDGKFSLRSNSESRRVLEEYVAEVMAKSKRKSLEHLDTKETLNGNDNLHSRISDGTVRQHGIWSAQKKSHEEMPPKMTAEDDAILDQIWDQIGREMGVLST